nr:hypothetical protein [Schwartzia sp. (in: firmicutes)]
MENVYVLGALRTPIVTKNGKFKTVPAEELGASVIRAITEKFPDAARNLSGVIGGNAVGTGGNITRLAALTMALGLAAFVLTPKETFVAVSVYLLLGICG